MIWLLKLIRVFTKTRYRFRDGVRQHKHGLFGTWRPGWFRTTGAVEAVAATDLAKGQPVTVGWDFSALGGQDCHCTALWIDGRLVFPTRNRLKELRPMIRCRGGR